MAMSDGTFGMVVVLQCDVHHKTPGDSNSKAQALSMDTGTGGATPEYVKGRES